MSLLTSVEKAIKSYKDEEARVNNCIELYKELLQSLTAPEEPEPNNDAATDTATSQVEMQEIELLEKALKKALHVRTGTRLFTKDPKGNKPTQPQKDLAAIPKEATLKASSVFKRNQADSKSTLKSANSDKKASKKPVISRSSATYGHGKCKSTTSKNVTKTQSNSMALKSVQHTAPGSISGGNITASGEQLTRVSAAMSHDRGDMEDHSLRQLRSAQGVQKEQWISLRIKQNRMWDKVMAAQRKPAPGRSRFMERMRATFPKDWPTGSPEQLEGLLGRLTHQVDELAQQCQTMDLLDQQIPDQSAESGMKEDMCSHLTPERLQIRAVDLQNFAKHAIKEWEAWDRWRPEGVCLYATRPAEDEAITRHLPVTITYASEAELRQLEAIRMRVALLQQEIYLQQALLDALSPQLASIIALSTNRSVLRDLYSLLGEGGQRFPAIVLDFEPE